MQARGGAASVQEDVRRPGGSGERSLTVTVKFEVEQTCNEGDQSQRDSQRIFSSPLESTMMACDKMSLIESLRALSCLDLIEDSIAADKTLWPRSRRSGNG